MAISRLDGTRPSLVPFPDAPGAAAAVPVAPPPAPSPLLDEGVPAVVALTPPKTARLVGEPAQRVYLAAQKLIVGQIDQSLASLDAFGVGAPGDFSAFASKLRQVHDLIARNPLYQHWIYPEHGPAISASEAAFADLLRAFGVSDPKASPHETFASACALRERLLAHRAEISGPYQDAKQTFELLQAFPDLSEQFYAAAAMPGLVGFPPTLRPQSAATPDEVAFARQGQRFVVVATRWRYAEMAGVIAAGIAITVATGGVGGAAAATVAGVVFGAAVSTVQIVHAQRALTFARDALAIGAASQMTVDFRDNELTGAYGGLVVNLVTAGIAARVGASGFTGSLATFIRSTCTATTIGAGSGALSTALNPNVWKSDNTFGLLLTGTALGGASGLGGSLVGSGLVATLRAAAPVMTVGVTPGTRVEVGARVSLASDKGTPIEAIVTKLDFEAGQMHLLAGGKTSIIQIASAELLTASTVPTLPSDLAWLNVDPTRFVPVASLKPGQPIYFVYSAQKPPVVAEVVSFDPNKAGMQLRLPNDVDIGMAPLTPGETASNFLYMRSDMRMMTNADGVTVLAAHGSVQAIDRLRAQASGVSMGRVVVNGHAYAQMDRRNDEAGALPSLVLWPSRAWDHNYAFAAPPDTVELPLSQMPAGVQARQVAVFGAHGAPTFFQGVSTRTAATLSTDAIVASNTSRSANQKIRYVLLSACSQGNKRGVLIGKTNAQAFQEVVNSRLRNHGIDPEGPEGITVLASDAPGGLWGWSHTTYHGREIPARFVAAADQNPLAYFSAQDARSLALRAVAGTGIAVGGFAGAYCLVVSIEDGDLLDGLPGAR